MLGLAKVVRTFGCKKIVYVNICIIMHVEYYNRIHIEHKIYMHA